VIGTALGVGNSGGNAPPSIDNDDFAQVTTQRSLQLRSPFLIVTHH